MQTFAIAVRPVQANVLGWWNGAQIVDIYMVQSLELGVQVPVQRVVGMTSETGCFTGYPNILEMCGRDERTIIYM